MAPRDDLTTLEYALLGLTARGAMSGYDVHRLFATTPLAHFSSSPGAIYPALRRLERRGMLAAALDRVLETRPRRVFSLTEAGRLAIERWLRQPVTREEILGAEGTPVLRFSLAEPHLSRRELLVYLNSYRRVLIAYVKELGAYLAGMTGEEMLVPRLALELGIMGFRSTLEWTERATAALQRPQSEGSRKRRLRR